MVKCIILYDEKLVITFNFKNEPVTVSTSDELLAIEGSSDIEAFASPNKNKTNLEQSRFVLFFTRDYFGLILQTDIEQTE